jgi:hypothetical protein
VKYVENAGGKCGLDIFCVLGPGLGEFIRSFQALGNQQFSSDGRQHAPKDQGSGGGKMSTTLAVKIAACSEYERLLEECQEALETWNQQRAEIYDSGLRGKRIDDELRRLQAKFARAYALLQNHAKNCMSCEFESRDEGSDSGNKSRGFAEHELYV